MNQDGVLENIKNTLGDKASQFIASTASLVNSDSNLAKCDRNSILSSCLVAASLSLPVNKNLGFAYIIPYGNKAQFQMGYKGFVQLAMRSGQFAKLNVTDVREGEVIKHDRLTGDIEFKWVEENRESIDVVGYVAYMQLTNGFSKQLYMTKKELLSHANKYSQSYKKNSRNMNLWRDDFNSMASKTVVKLLLSRFAPMNIEMQKAIEFDQAVIENGKPEYVDNQVLTAEEVGEERERERIIKHIEESKTLQELSECDEAIQEADLREMYDAKKELLGKGK